MRVAVAAAMFLVGCGSDTPNDCSIGTVEDDYIAGATLDDCGAPDDDGISGTDTAAFQAAQACALDHAQQQQPFRVRWTAHGLEGPIARGYVGLVRDGTWTLAAFDQSALITGKVPPASRDTCSDLRAMSPCYSFRSNLCIECVGRVTGDQCTP